MALRSGGGVGEGVAAIRAAVSTRPYLWSNLIMIDHYGAAAVEVRDRTIVVTASFGRRLGGRGCHRGSTGRRYIEIEFQSR